MPRNFPINMLQQLIQQYGSSPNISITINWGGVGPEFQHAFDANLILDIGKLTTTIKTSGAAVVSSIPLTIDDSSGLVKSIFSVARMEKSYAAVYLDFPGSTERFLIFSGRATGPFKWSEGDRAFSFNLVTDLHAEEIGFEPIGEDFPDIDPDADGVPWPVVFGSVAHVPAVLIHKKAEGRLRAQIHLKSKVYEVFSDVTKSPANDAVRLVTSCTVYSDAPSDDPDDDTEGTTDNVIYVEGGAGFPQDQVCTIAIEGVLFTGVFHGSSFVVQTANANKYTNVQFGSRPHSDDDWVQGTVAWLADSTTPVSLVNHFIKVYYPPVYVNGKLIPEGYMTLYVNRQEKNKVWFSSLPMMAQGTPILIASSCTIKEARGVEACGLTCRITEFLDQVLPRSYFKRYNGESIHNIDKAAVAAMLDHVRGDSTFWEADEDTVVRLWNTTDADVYIANLFTSSRVRGVYGVRRVHGRRKFVPIPKNYYQINTALAVYGKTSTAVIFHTPLKDYVEQEWESQIYVSMDSDIGGPPSQLILWLLENYTTLGFDVGSFNSVYNRTVNMPCNFAIFEKEDALQLAEKIAFQNRCGILIDNGATYLRYLPDTPAIPEYFAEESIQYKSIEIGLTDLTEVKTKLTGKWKPSYRPLRDQDIRDERKHAHRISSHVLKAVVRENIAYYGTVEEEMDIIAYNNEDLVFKTLNFWRHRKANVWRTVSFKGFIYALHTQPFDAIGFTLADSGLVGPYIGLVSSISFDFKTKDVDVQVILPVTEGNTATDSAFWWNENDNTSYYNPISEVRIKRADFQAKGITYDRMPSVEVPTTDFKDATQFEGKITKTPRSSSAPPTIIPDSGQTVLAFTNLPSMDRHIVDIYGEGVETTATEEAITAFSNCSHKIFDEGDRVVMKLGAKGDLQITDQIDDAIVKVTGDGAGKGYYTGKLTSALAAIDLTNSTLTLSNGQNKDCIIINLDEGASTAAPTIDPSALKLSTGKWYIPKFLCYDPATGKQYAMVAGANMQGSVVSNVQWDSTNGLLQKKTLNLATGVESGWSTFETASECP